MSFGARELLWLAAVAPTCAAAVASWLWRRRLRATAAWAARGLWDRLALRASPLRLAASVAFLGLAVAGTALALARPRWGASSERVERRGVDVVYVLDTSLSMAAPDVRPSRLFAAQALVRRLVAALPGHRAALVLAEGDGTVMAPLTVDAGVIDLLLDTAQPGALPVPGTRLAPALEVASRLFPEGDGKHRAVVLLSDGEDHGGEIEPQVERLRQAGIVVHALGVGTPRGAPLPLPGAGGPHYKRDEESRVVISRLGEALLEGLARSTGGVYLRVTTPAADPRPVLDAIRGMETRTWEAEVSSALEERFQWPAAVAALALALHLGIGPFAPEGRGRP